MYASRILPPPLPLAADNPPGPGPGPVYASFGQPKPDALLEHKIMTGYDHEQNSRAAAAVATSNSQIRTTSSPGASSRHHLEQQSPRSDDIADLPPASRSAGAKRKRGPDAAQEGQHQQHQQHQHQHQQHQQHQQRGQQQSGGSGDANAAAAKERLPAISDSALASKPVDSPSQICLCQPDPKVPRPRNAFILYRQHHQAKVVAENPGLANPEISKIIGDLWRQSPQETKQHWKNLAEEEKIRHQRQYPDYRYQPKRGRNSVPTATPPGQGSPRCLKCGGKSMATPNLTSPGFRPPNINNNNNNNNAATTTTTSNMNSASADTPMSPYPPGGMITRTAYAGPAGYVVSPGASQAYIHRAIPATRPGDRSPGLESPEAKRRRYEAAAVRYPSRSTGPMTPIAMTPVDQRLPRPEFLRPASGSFVVGPVPAARAHQQVSINHPRGGGGHSHSPSQNSGRNENLTLAPLQINRNSHDSNQCQVKSVEAMIMSIKPLTKLKTLAKIAPPLQRPGPASPPHPIRGAVIAVEGNDHIAMEAVGTYIRADLERNSEHVVRAWASPQLELFDRGGSWSLMDVLQLMSHWHGISAEIVKYITRPPDDDVVASQLDTPISPRSRYAQPPGIEGQRASLSTSGRSMPDSRGGGGGGTEGKKLAVPVALIPNYQLTTTDATASFIPISDYYSPIDHWQWIAALWRGTVGPDVVICVRSVDDVDAGGSPRDGPAGKPKSGVEVRLEEARTIIVRCEKKGEISDQVLRRVAFEVGEWVRSRDEREK